MDTWKLANVLLNKGKFDDCSHGCPGMFYPELLPGGDLAPSINDSLNRWEHTKIVLKPEDNFPQNNTLNGLVSQENVLLLMAESLQNDKKAG